MKHAVTAGLLILATTQAVTAQTGRKFTILGHGASTCGQWTADQRLQNLSSNSDKAWLLGYITAFNRFGGEPVGNVSSGVDPEGMMAFMNNYCAAHPLDTIEDGANELVQELRRRKR